MINPQMHRQMRIDFNNMIIRRMFDCACVKNYKYGDNPLLDGRYIIEFEHWWQTDFNRPAIHGIE